MVSTFFKQNQTSVNVVYSNTNLICVMTFKMEGCCTVFITDLVIRSDVCKVNKGVHSQSNTQSSTFPGYRCHLFPGDLQCTQMLPVQQEIPLSVDQLISDQQSLWLCKMGVHLYLCGEICGSNLSKGSVELDCVYFFIHGDASLTPSNCKHAAIVIPLDTGHIHLSVKQDWIWTQKDIAVFSTKAARCLSVYLVNITALPNVLTFIVLIAHYLPSSIVKDNSKTWTIRLDVTLCSRIPMNACYTDGSSDIG